MVTERERRLYEDLYGSVYKQELIRMRYPDHVLKFERDRDGVMRCLVEGKRAADDKTKK